MPPDPRKTWQYFAQAVIQEEDPKKLTYLMKELYRVLKDNEEQAIRALGLLGMRRWGFKLIARGVAVSIRVPSARTKNIKI